MIGDGYGRVGTDAPESILGSLPSPAFRHDPGKAILTLKEDSTGSTSWLTEPAVCGYRSLSYRPRRADDAVPVPVCSTPAVVTGIGVVLAGFDGRVRFFSRALEKVYWERQIDSPVYASVVVDASRRTVLVAATSGLVVCMDLRGRTVWSAKTGSPIFATPVVLPNSDVVIVAAFGSRCIGLDLGTGKQVFERGLPEPWHARYGGSAAHRDPYASPVATAANNVLVCCAEHVLCLAPDGMEVWQHEVGCSIKASPAALHAVREVAVCSVDGRCMFLDSDSGDTRGEVVLGSKIVSSPAVSGDVVAVGTQAGTAFGVDGRRHDVIWVNPEGAPSDHTSFTVLPDGNFIATSTRGNVVCLGASDGRFQWESSQVLGLGDHDPALSITPIVGPDGSMYCGSYSGMVYHFRFRSVQ